MKAIKKNSLLLLTITIIVLYFIVKDNFIEIIKCLSNANLFLILVSLFMIVLYVLFQSLALLEIIRNHKKSYTFKKAVNLVLITNFFNGVTPFATGGQPMQIYYLNKENIRLTASTNLIIQNFIIYQTVLVLYGIAAVFLNYQFNIFESIPVLRQLILVGFVINALILLGLYTISFSKKIKQLILKLGIFIVTLINKKADKNKLEIIWDERCRLFHQGTKELIKSKSTCIKSFIYHFLSLTCLYVLPFFVFLALKQNNISIIEVITSSAYVMIIGSFVPIPGGSGGIEFGFIRFFGSFVQGSTLNSGLLVWRFLTYYLLIIIGAVILNVRKESDN